MRNLILFFALTLPSYQFSQTAAEVMFVGFNADSDDGFSFATLVPLANGTTIYFTDNNWDGVSAFSSGEGLLRGQMILVIPYLLALSFLSVT